MPDGRWPDPEQIGLPRGAIAGILSGGSVLGSRAFADLLSTVFDFLDLGIAGLLVYQTSSGSGLLGLQLSWLLAIYLVYIYTPKLYLGYFSEIVAGRGFRAMTAGVSGYYGLLLSDIIGAVPDTMVFGLIPNAPPLVSRLFFGGAAVGIAAFAIYIKLTRREAIVDEGTRYFEALDAFSVDPHESMLWRMKQLPRPLQWLIIFLTAMAIGVIFLAPSFVIGFVLAIVNSFYPIPEGLIFVGIVLKYSPRGPVFGDRTKPDIVPDIEFGTAQWATDAVQNLKGAILVIYSVVGMLLCGMVFIMGIGIAESHLGTLLTMVRSLAANKAIQLSAFGNALTLILFVIGVMVFPFVYGSYGLFYWFRQLKRLPAYANYWEQRKLGRTRRPPDPSVDRPPGLFLPANAYFLVLGAILWWTGGEAPTILIAGLFDVVWPVIVIIIGWTVYRATSGSPRSLIAEGRAIIAALNFQVLTMLFIGIAITSNSTVANPIGIVAVTTLLVALGYYPDVTIQVERYVGLLSYTNVVYLAGLLALSLTLLEAVYAVPLFLYAFAVVIIPIYTLFIYYDEKIDL